MPYIYSKVEELDGKPLVGTHQCVVLVQHYAGAPHTSKWKQGESVKGNTVIKKGTAIATFEEGKYPNKAYGNHAALYISQDKDSGILLVMDQQRGDPNKETISKRHIRPKGTDKSGKLIDPSNNADAFSIIE